MAKDFKDSGYDLKHLMRTIVQSRTYQLSATPNESNKEDKIDYSHAAGAAAGGSCLAGCDHERDGCSGEIRASSSGRRR